MHNKNTKSRLVSSIARQVSLAMFTALFLSAVINAQTSLFSLQAKLPNDVSPATGDFEMKFKLFDAATDGTQIGATNFVQTVEVKTRAFAVWLDFGAAAFSGADRFIEISYRRNSNQPFDIVLLRQPVLSVPYAIRSLTATTADNSLSLNGVDASSFVQTTDSRLSDSRNPNPGSNNYIQNTTTQQASADFNISGSGTANVLNVTTQYNIGGDRILSNAGNNNVFAGVGAGAVNTGSENAFFGRNAGNANTTGRLNSFFGNTAGSRNTTGGGNSIFGAFAGIFNSIGNNNSFFGVAAGNSNTTGSNNAFFGTNAGRGNTTAGGNAFFGIQAGLRNTTGKDNAFFGQRAGEQNLTADGNSFFGNDSGARNTTGGANSFFGLGAGYQTLSGSDNVFLGRSAGDVNSTGGNNTLVGARANTGANNLNFATAIGAGAVVNSSNTVVVGRTADTVRIPGKVILGNSFLETFNFNGVINGISVSRNLVIDDNGLNNLLPSPVHLCIIGQLTGNGTGGQALTRCTSSSSSSSNKADLVPFSGGLEIINRLKPIAFKWKQGGEPDFGLNAEDVAEIEPLFVTRDSRGKAEDIKENSLNVVFINAFKQQQAQIQGQEKKIQTQQEQIKRQQQQINALKNLVCLSNAQAEVCK